MPPDEQLRRWMRTMERRLGSMNGGGGDPGEHNHSGVYAPVHGHPYATTAHNHDTAYAPVHTHPYEASGAVAAHAAAGDPHPGYLTSAEGNGAYATAGHTHAGGGASPVTVQKATVDQAISTVTLANATDLSFTVTAGQDREFEYVLPITSAALTTGFQVGFTFPLLNAAGYFLAVVEYQSSATAWTVQTLNVTATNVGSVAGALVTAAYVVAPTPLMARIKGIVANPTAGTVALQFRSEVAGSAITVKRGATLKYA